MPLIWAAISAHGYGHAAQVVPVLNALGRLVPDLRAVLRTTVPASFFRDRLSIPWEVSPVPQDVGCVQQGPLTIDIEATWREHERFHANWNERLEAEVSAMQALRPNLVLADTPYLALVAGKQAGRPTVVLASFTWDLVLHDYQAPSSIDKAALLRFMQHAYSHADQVLRITPAPAFNLPGNVVDIAPLAEPAAPERQRLADLLRLQPHERTVLVAFGGIPLPSLPVHHVDNLKGYRFLYDGADSNGSAHIVSRQHLPLSFKTLMASVDLIMTKPGYGTLVEAVALQIPVLYVRRYHFVDEEPLVDYLHRHGRGLELSLDDFTGGRWHSALGEVTSLPAPATPPPPLTGAQEAATLLASHFLCPE